MMLGPSYLYKIIGVCLHVLDLVIRDWLEPPSLESPQPKRATVKRWR
jgi:hypothetical protein